MGKRDLNQPTCAHVCGPILSTSRNVFLEGFACEWVELHKNTTNSRIWTSTVWSVTARFSLGLQPAYHTLLVSKEAGEPGIGCRGLK